MSQKLKALRDKRGQLVADARAMLDKAETEKRKLSPEEEVTYKKLFDDQDAIRAQIEREEQLTEAERQSAAQSEAGREAAAAAARAAGGAAAAPGARANPRGTPEYREAFRRFVIGGRDTLSAAEVRALQADSDPAGGFAVAPEQFVKDLIIFVNNQVLIRGLATKFTLDSAQSMGAPSLETDIADADWTSELATGGEDSAMAYGKRELHPRPLAKRIKVANKLLRLSPDAETLVRERLAYKFGVAQEKAFMTGTGASQPLGVFTASAMGITTARDVSTGNSTTAPSFDGLISAKYALKPQYWEKASWIMHRDVVAVVAKLKDGEGQYLWRQSVRDGEPDMVLGRPLLMSEYAPNTFTTGLYVGILGDFSRYWICDAIDLQVQRLVELYAETNQTGFIGRLETDGMPVLAEAFVRVKLA